ncbi:hypothetical protein Cgig2_006923 [Carnegiea gigantea]|uniref:Myb-like domain-containing protein n=1 Tax=Carnegiea gigantea TaxID=171969 RepID=A0A9Q1GFW8_9CARY|nr:hypothetical protein Cgig2_006923 [Carnegiea gigantea]
MALAGRKSRNWTNKEDEKLLNVLIEQKAQRATQFEWSVVKALLKVQGIDRDATQIRNHYNDTRAPPNLDKIKAAVHGKHANGDLSFSPAMGASGSQRRPVQQNLVVDLEEHVGDSDETDDDEYNEQTETNALKRRSEGGSSGDRRRLRQELDAKVHNALELMRLKAESRLNPPPSIYEKVLTKLRQHPGVATKGPDFIFTMMEYIRLKLFAFIVRPHRSEDEVPPEIAQKSGFYWPYFRYVVNHHKNVHNVYDHPLFTTYSKICTLLCRTVLEH